MPTLKQITCHIERGSHGASLREYSTSYGDGVVETFVGVPTQGEPFSIRLSSEGYIAPGLAMFVFMDGVPQCNRNRRNLVMPASGSDPEQAGVNFYVRQKEEKIDSGRWLGRRWTFASLDTAAADASPNMSKDVVDNIGIVEVVVLRCKGAGQDPSGGYSIPERRRVTFKDTKDSREKSNSSHLEARGLDAIDDSAMDGTIDMPHDGDDAVHHQIVVRSGLELDGTYDNPGEWGNEPKWDAPANEARNGANNANTWNDAKPAWQNTDNQQNQGDWNGENNNEHAKNPSQQLWPGDFVDNNKKVEPVGGDYANPYNHTNEAVIDGASKAGSPAANGGITINQFVGRQQDHLAGLDDAFRRHDLRHNSPAPVRRVLTPISPAKPMNYITPTPRQSPAVNTAPPVTTQAPYQPQMQYSWEVPQAAPAYGPSWAPATYQPSYLPYNNGYPPQPQPHPSYQLPAHYRRPSYLTPKVDSAFYDFSRNPAAAYNEAVAKEGKISSDRQASRRGENSGAWIANDANKNEKHGSQHGGSQHGSHNNSNNNANCNDGGWDDANNGDNNQNDRNDSGAWDNNNNNNNNDQTDAWNNTAGGDGWNNSNTQQNDNAGGNDWNNDNAQQNSNDAPGWNKASSPPPGPSASKSVRKERSSSSGHTVLRKSSEPFKPVTKPYWDPEIVRAQRLASSSSTPGKSRRRTSCMQPEPSYGIPATHPDAENLSHRVQAGEGVIYHHRTGRPSYIDSFKDPYAVFIFKYRSFDMLKKILGEDVQPVEKTKKEKEASKKKLMSMTKEELVRLATKAKKAAGYGTDSSLEETEEEEGSSTHQGSQKSGPKLPQVTTSKVSNETRKTGDKHRESKNDWNSGNAGGERANTGNTHGGGWDDKGGSKQNSNDQGKGGGNAQAAVETDW
ncbi:MAG: hypothetical protein M1828_001527 [Chrysothrix sp. TS-e1954]|nr:MAG: hypothetical protein M1828_001527 [Chrysothrix sp. TS-e1954]